MTRETALADLEKLSPAEADMLNSDPELLSRFKAKHGLDVPAPAPAAPPSLPRQIMQGVKQGYQMATPTGAAKTALRLIDKGQTALGEKTTELATRAGAGPKLAATAGVAAPLLVDAAVTYATGGESKIPALENASRGLAQRALGFSKRFLTSANARRKALVAGEAALQNNVIPLSGNPAVMSERANVLVSESGAALGKLRDVGKKSVEPIVARLEGLAESKLKNAEGGAWDAIKGRFQEAINTVKGIEAKGTIQPKAAESVKTGIVDQFGKEVSREVPAVKGLIPPTDISRMEDAKKLIADTVNWLVDNPGKQQQVKSIVGEIESGVEDILRAAGVDMTAYQAAKKIYGAAKSMQMGLNNELSGQLGNQLLKMKPAIAAASEFAAGNPIKGALTAISGNLVQNRGAGTAAVLLRQASRARLSALPAAVHAGSNAADYLERALDSRKRARRRAEQ